MTPDGYIGETPTVISVNTSIGNVSGVTFVDEPLRSVAGSVLEDLNNDGTGDGTFDWCDCSACE